MPHITLEYTSNIIERPDCETLLSGLHQIISNTTGADLATCKGRMRQLDEYCIGDSTSDDAFIYLQIFLLEGRPKGVRQALGRAALEYLAKFYQQSLDELTLKINVSVDELKDDCYFKYQ